jgi:hypothetical protein
MFRYVGMRVQFCSIKLSGLVHGRQIRIQLVVWERLFQKVSRCTMDGVCLMFVIVRQILCS